MIPDQEDLLGATGFNLFVHVSLEFSSVYFELNTASRIQKVFIQVLGPINEGGGGMTSLLEVSNSMKQRFGVEDSHFIESPSARSHVCRKDMDHFLCGTSETLGCAVLIGIEINLASSVCKVIIGHCWLFFLQGVSVPFCFHCCQAFYTSSF